MNFLSPAYIIFFKDSNTENQLNILLDYMVADDNMLSCLALLAVVPGTS